MKALVLDAPQQLRLGDWPAPVTIATNPGDCCGALMLTVPTEDADRQFFRVEVR